MYIKIKLNDKILSVLKNYCKNEKIDLNDFIQTAIFEKIERENIREKMTKNKYIEFDEDEIIEELNEILEDFQKYKH
jgi:signal transduction histidine kinase